MTVLNRQTADRLEALRVKLDEETGEAGHGIKVGDIFYSSWGYDQTNIDFYQVVSVTKGTVSIREITKSVVSGEGGPAEGVMPNIGDFEGPPMRKRPSPSGSLKLTSYSSAYKWDGKPKSRTGAAYGH